MSTPMDFNEAIIKVEIDKLNKEGKLRYALIYKKKLYHCRDIIKMFFTLFMLDMICVF